jgi:hypothetical protein
VGTWGDEHGTEGFKSTEGCITVAAAPRVPVLVVPLHACKIPSGIEQVRLQSQMPSKWRNACARLVAAVGSR